MEELALEFAGSAVASDFAASSSGRRFARCDRPAEPDPDRDTGRADAGRDQAKAVSRQAERGGLRPFVTFARRNAAASPEQSSERLQVGSFPGLRKIGCRVHRN